MNFHVYLDDELGKEIEMLCRTTHKKRNAIIREALRMYIQDQKKAVWPDSVLSFEGVSKYPPFESSRKELGKDSRKPFLD